ncbi:MAG TPA: DUF6494 family protein, partial [Candidatus Acidoferrum sp.]|nr:DUF6494 family protein [Candidatus Acidoferrum sp.]
MISGGGGIGTRRGVHAEAAFPPPAAPALHLTDRSERMDEDQFNISVRKFLKVVGVTSQREIEKAVREALASGRLRGTETLEAKMTLEIGATGLV